MAVFHIADIRRKVEWADHFGHIPSHHTMGDDRGCHISGQHGHRNAGHFDPEGTVSILDRRNEDSRSDQNVFGPLQHEEEGIEDLTLVFVSEYRRV